MLGQNLTCTAPSIDWKSKLAVMNLLAFVIAIAPIEISGSLAQAKSAWKRECVGAAGSAGEKCFVRQRVAVEGKIVMIGSFGVTSDKAPFASIQIPLGTALKAGLSVGADKGEATNHRFDFCSRSGCTANVPLGDELLAALRAGSKLNVIWVNAEGKRSGLRFDLVGFSAAWDSVNK